MLVCVVLMQLLCPAAACASCIASPELSQSVLGHSEGEFGGNLSTSTVGETHCSLLQLPLSGRAGMPCRSVLQLQVIFLLRNDYRWIR